MYRPASRYRATWERELRTQLSAPTAVTSLVFPNYPIVATSGLAIQASGDIVILGTATTTSLTVFALARYTPSGQLDTTFGTHGTVVTQFGGGIQVPSVSANGLAIQSDGKIVAVGGYTAFVPYHGFDTAFKIVRYLGQ